VTPLVLVQESPATGLRHEARSGMTIGREGSDVVLNDREVSRRHARLRLLGEGLAIEDLGSTNGTFLNGNRVTGVSELKHGDVLKLGNSSLRIEVEVQAGASAAADPLSATPRAEPAAPAAAHPPPGAGGARGDVPAPPAESASRVHRPFAGSPAPAQHAFRADEAARTKRASAATRLEATLVSYGVVIATVIALAIYLSGR